MKTRALALILPLLLWTLPAPGEEVTVTSFDEFPLTALIEGPEDKSADAVERVVVLVHGSGSHGYDMDLSSITEGQKENRYFRTLAHALVERGFTVLRYNKRSYQVSIHLQSHPEYRGSDELQEFVEHPFEYFIKDASRMASYAGERFPAARVYLFGVSQGTQVALQAARMNDGIAGLAFIGFYATPIETLTYEQTVHRPLFLFKSLDASGDGEVTTEELDESEDIFASAIKQQLVRLDRDGDGRLSRTEFMAGNMVNWLLSPDVFKNYRRDEARLPRPADVLAKLEIPVLFFHGLWDNQTPAFQTMAIEHANEVMWQKPFFHFEYFKGLGHGLDPRTSYDDLLYRVIDPEALDTVVKTLDERFVEDQESMEEEDQGGEGEKKEKSENEEKEEK